MIERSTGPRPIETVYGGHRFRSRLEARWAVFLDALGVGWQYEWQGYDLPSGPYLPDFWLPRIGGSHARGLFLEVKGSPVKADMDRAAELCEVTGASVVVVSELPRLHNVHVAHIDDVWVGSGLEGYGGWIVYRAEPGPDGGWLASSDTGHVWCVCPECCAPGLEFEGRSARGAHRPGCDRYEREGRGHAADHPVVLAAYEKAARARFEFGATPTPAEVST